MTKTQLTITLDELQFQALEKIADLTFEGNRSMALRAFLRNHNIVRDANLS